ncbi:MAG: hypothetical protein CML13_20140 [Puniceicoccaceae bacterium]|nr:hypothetical protein [Puniceicoccaceae bacterium]|tara:strand:+ start:252 stop:476 length:225 start_codon:yes stop_codon:yes gene_type:complete
MDKYAWVERINKNVRSSSRPKQGKLTSELKMLKGSKIVHPKHWDSTKMKRGAWELKTLLSTKDTRYRKIAQQNH